MNSAALAVLVLFLISTIHFAASTTCVCNHGYCDSNNICVCNQYYEGFDCSIYNREIQSGELISDTIPSYFWKYYNLNITSYENRMNVEVVQTSPGDIDVYISTSTFPSVYNNILYDSSSDIDVNLSVNLHPGEYYIGLYGYAACSYTLQVTVQASCINNCNGNGICDTESYTCNCFNPFIGDDCSTYYLELAFGDTYHGVINSKSWLFYYFTTDQIGDLSLVMTQQATSAIQILLKRETLPNFNSFDYANTTLSTQVELHIQNLDPSLWVIGLFGFTSGVYSLKTTVAFPEIPNCTSECSLHGTCSGTTCTCDEGYIGDLCENAIGLVQFDQIYPGETSASFWNYWAVQYITSQSINVHLSKLEGNCHLFIRPSAYPTHVIFQYSDLSSDPEVDLVIQYPGSTLWYVGVFGYSDCIYNIDFSFVERCQCDERANGHCESGSTACICDPGWAGSGCDLQTTRLESFEVIHSSVVKNELKYFFVVSNSSALIITMVEKNTKGFAWLLIGTDGFPTLDNRDELNIGYASEMSFHENRYLWSNKRERTHYISVLGSSVDISPDPVAFAITVYSAPF